MKDISNSLTEKAYAEAVKVLEKCSTPHGFFAAYPGYDAVWSRDSMITSLGASLLNKKFKKTFAASIKTLADNQSEKGQIPNAVDKFSKRKHHVDFTSIDSTLWFIIGHYIYKQRYKDNSLFNSQKNKVKNALNWLSYQSISEQGTPEQLPTTDWQDAFPHKYGRTINTQALYYKILKLTNQNSKAKKLKQTINKNKETKLWNSQFYLAWRWKNHHIYKEKGEWFDSLGNLLAVIFNLADGKKADSILNYINHKKINKPFPVKAIFPPIKKTDREWQDYFSDCDARIPFHYLNAGIWTYIGGFYILALIKQKKFREAERELKKLAEANLKGKTKFSEWLDGKTGAPSRYGNQAWNAGMYILAYNSLKKKKVLI